jgi:DNA-binding LytR/AlgR family response regulator
MTRIELVEAAYCREQPRHPAIGHVALTLRHGARQTLLCRHNCPRLDLASHRSQRADGLELARLQRVFDEPIIIVFVVIFARLALARN